jgi:hypothetical protein
MPRLALLADRSPQVVLPALSDALADVKLEPLSLASIDHVVSLEPEAILVDAAEHPAQAWAVLRSLRERDPRYKPSDAIAGIESTYGNSEHTCT